MSGWYHWFSHDIVCCNSPIIFWPSSIWQFWLELNILVCIVSRVRASHCATCLSESVANLIEFVWFHKFEYCFSMLWCWQILCWNLLMENHVFQGFAEFFGCCWLYYFGWQNILENGHCHFVHWINDIYNGMWWNGFYTWQLVAIHYTGIWWIFAVIWSIFFGPPDNCSSWWYCIIEVYVGVYPWYTF